MSNHIYRTALSVAVTAGLLVGLLSVAKADPAGKELYVRVCSLCHKPVNIMVSSPKAGDTVDWGARLSKGIEATVDNGMNGINAMPPRGTCDSCTREEIRDAILFMASPEAAEVDVN